MGMPIQDGQPMPEYLKELYGILKKGSTVGLEPYDVNMVLDIVATHVADIRKLTDGSLTLIGDVLVLIGTELSNSVLDKMEDDVIKIDSSMLENI